MHTFVFIYIYMFIYIYIMRICKYVTVGISMALHHVWCRVLYPIVLVSLWAQLRGEPILSSWECCRDYVGWAENDRGVSYVFGTETQRAVDVISGDQSGGNSRVH